MRTGRLRALTPMCGIASEDPIHRTVSPTVTMVSLRTLDDGLCSGVDLD
jgi:hypothetical protein